MCKRFQISSGEKHIPQTAEHFSVFTCKAQTNLEYDACLKQSRQNFPSCTKMWKHMDNKNGNYKNEIKLVAEERKPFRKLVDYFTSSTF